MDLTLTSVVATQLWHHIFLGGGLCDLPVWTPTPMRKQKVPGLDLGVALAPASHAIPAQ
jgi:asparagine synthase (glutamine-hydrolysing)